MCHSASKLLFPGMWLLIAAISSFDSFLTVRYREHLFYEELNPIARYLLQIDGWEPSLLIAAKFLGSTLALGFLMALHIQNRRLALIVATAVTGFQIALLGFLTLA